mmetsp:Transcript_25906/g.37133  ORF Transcript_25906/g.37133 Transcript_25906/m.37133 type:complete len:101 (+) Transcript_25906:63-365(+)
MFFFSSRNFVRRDRVCVEAVQCAAKLGVDAEQPIFVQMRRLLRNRIRIQSSSAKERQAVQIRQSAAVPQLQVFVRGQSRAISLFEGFRHSRPPTNQCGMQ